MIEHRVILGEAEVWYKDGLIHRDDGPAVIHADGTKFWIQNGKIHRDNGPAVIYCNGAEEWWFKGDQVDPLVVFILQKEVA